MTPKEDQQPMTTREELVAIADEMKAFLDRSTMNSMAEEFLRKVVSALRLASRQEASVEAIAREFRRAMLDNPTDDGFNARAIKRERIADEYARALLAKYSITKRTTEG